MSAKLKVMQRELLKRMETVATTYRHGGIEHPEEVLAVHVATELLREATPLKLAKAVAAVQRMNEHKSGEGE